MRALLDGAKGPYRDIVLLNAAAALLVAEQGRDPARRRRPRRRRSIDDGRAQAALDRLVEATNDSHERHP